MIRKVLCVVCVASVVASASAGVLLHLRVRNGANEPRQDEGHGRCAEEIVENDAADDPNGSKNVQVVGLDAIGVDTKKADGGEDHSLDEAGEASIEASVLPHSSNDTHRKTKIRRSPTSPAARRSGAANGIGAVLFDTTAHGESLGGKLTMNVSDGDVTSEGSSKTPATKRPPVSSKSPAANCTGTLLGASTETGLSSSGMEDDEGWNRSDETLYATSTASFVSKTAGGSVDVTSPSPEAASIFEERVQSWTLSPAATIIIEACKVSDKHVFLAKCEERFCRPQFLS